MEPDEDLAPPTTHEDMVRWGRAMQDVPTLSAAVGRLTDALVETEMRRREDFLALVRYVADQGARIDLLLEQWQAMQESLVTIAAAVRQYHERERTDLEKGRPVLFVVDQNNRSGH